MAWGSALAQSLVVKRQRQQLTEIGDAIGTKVVFLKAAWADPVLYEGRGERYGSDIDILVEAGAFVEFAEYLKTAGYERLRFVGREALNEARKEWAFEGRSDLSPPQLPIDLHRGLADAPWFEMPPEPCLQAAVHYDSPDGPILSLAPSDQVSYAAVHYANHGLDLDDRHVNDTARICGAYPIGWEHVAEGARRGSFYTALVWLARRLRQRNAEVPDWLVTGNATDRWRLRCIEALYQPELSPAWHQRRRIVALALVSDRATALPYFVIRYVALRAAG